MNKPAEPTVVSGAQQAIAHPGPSLVDVVCQPLHEAQAPVSERVA
ncbi:MAG: hypothetical protein ACWGNS_11295 [Burkholderiales bacterium]